MAKLPFSLRVLAWFNLAVALSMPVQIMAIYEHSFFEWQAIADKLTSLNYLVMFAAVGNAMLILRGEKWALYMTPAVLGVVGMNNFFVAIYATDYSPFMAGLAFFSFAFMHIPVALHQELLANPRMQWWRTSPRQQVSLPITIGDVQGRTLISNTFDISETGVFMPLDLEQMNRQAEMEDVRVLLDLGGSNHLRCSAKVARRTVGVGKYPAGIGLRFEDMGEHERAHLRRILNQ